MICALVATCWQGKKLQAHQLIWNIFYKVRCTFAGQSNSSSTPFSSYTPRNKCTTTFSGQILRKP